jgi:hypothetical protein
LGTKTKIIDRETLRNNPDLSLMTTKTANLIFGELSINKNHSDILVQNLSFFSAELPYTIGRYTMKGCNKRDILKHRKIQKIESLYFIVGMDQRAPIN